MYQVNHTPTRQPGLLQRAENPARDFCCKSLRGKELGQGNSFYFYAI